MDGVEVVHSVEHWQAVAERLRSGDVFLSTGWQCRTAEDLGAWIENAVWGADGNVALTLDWDSVLSVAQAG